MGTLLRMWSLRPSQAHNVMSLVITTVPTEDGFVHSYFIFNALVGPRRSSPPPSAHVNVLDHFLCKT
jgi:hypothetical protein